MLRVSDCQNRSDPLNLLDNASAGMWNFYISFKQNVLMTRMNSP